MPLRIELPDAIAEAAREAGLLTPQALNQLLSDALRRQRAADSLLSVAQRVAAAGVVPMSMDEINAEVKAARAERREAQAKELVPIAVAVERAARATTSPPR